MIVASDVSTTTADKINMNPMKKLPDVAINPSVQTMKISELNINVKQMISMVDIVSLPFENEMNLAKQKLAKKRVTPGVASCRARWDVRRVALAGWGSGVRSRADWRVCVTPLEVTHQFYTSHAADVAADGSTLQADGNVEASTS